MKAYQIGFLALVLMLGSLAAPVGAQCDPSGTINCDLYDAQGVDFSNGDDVFTVPFGTRLASNTGDAIDALGGNDLVINEGMISARVRSVDLGAGNDTMINRATIREGEIGVHAREGDDIIENYESLTGRRHGIIAELGNNTVMNNGDLQGLGGSGAIVTGTLTNNGLIAGGGNAAVVISGTLTNNGLINATWGDGVRGGVGDDTIFNAESGTITGRVNGWSGNDVIEIWGVVGRGGVEGWSGDDLIILQPTADVTGTVTGGAGNDTLRLALTVPAEEYGDLAEQIANANPQQFRLTIDGKIYTFLWFETVENALVPR